MGADGQAVSLRSVALVVCLASLALFAVLGAMQLALAASGSHAIVFNLYSLLTWIPLAFTAVAALLIWLAKLPPWAISILLVGNALHLAWLLQQLRYALAFMF